jgi:CTP:molybdopterin cytidylyltransferase MocA
LRKYESTLPPRTKTNRPVAIVPVILAADSGHKIGFPRALATFGTKTALQIAFENCSALAPPVVVVSPKLARLLGGAAGALHERQIWQEDRPALDTPRILQEQRSALLERRYSRLVVHQRGPRGQLGSLLAGLRLVPAEVPFMIYAVDYPLLTGAVVRRLVEAFKTRLARYSIVLPRYRGRAGHPVIFAPELRGELAGAESARAVIYRDPRRVKFVTVRDSSISKDFDTPAAYRRVLREYLRRFGK